MLRTTLPVPGSRAPTRTTAGLHASEYASVS